MATEMNLWTRLTSESPVFFKKIIKIALYITATITGVYISLKAIPDFVIPDIITTIYGYAVTIGIVVAAVAKTTITDSSKTPTP